MYNKKYLIFVNEFFGAWDINTKGGYGFLVRKLLPSALKISLENFVVCLGKSKTNYFSSEKFVTEEGIVLIKLPRIKYFAIKEIEQYDIIISIEATVDYLFKFGNHLNKKILFWIQDPRTEDDWQEISTVKIAKEESWFNEKTNMLVKKCYESGNIKFVTQAKYLASKAIKLYHLPRSVNVDFLPNPIEEYFGKYEKENNIIFLGRLDSVKRGWIFCEIAKRMPEYNFLVLGASTNSAEKGKNSILDKYKNIKNLKFLGHIDGKEKKEQLKKAKILVNTSIHEALPVSFLEAFVYGITVVSNQNPDNLVEKYGKYIGSSLGDGIKDVDKFVSAISFLMNNEELRGKLADEAKIYVRNVHGHENFRKLFMNYIKEL